MNTQLNRKRIMIFVAFTFGITWAGTLAMYLTVGQNDLMMAGYLANWVFTLWSPALANVATRLITKEGRGRLMLRPNFRRGWRFYLAAWLLPFLATVVGAAAYYLLFPQFFDSNVSEMRKLFVAPPSLATWAAAADSWVILLAMALLLVMTYVPIYSILSFGEEFGWRAYLLPKLVAHFSGASAQDSAPNSRRHATAVWKAALLVGLIWGVWHWPGRLLFSGMSFLHLLLDLVPMCSASLLLAWVTLRSDSMWPAALGHSAYNQAMVLPIYSVKGPASPLLGPAPSGLIASIGYVILALVLLLRSRPFAEGKEAGEEKEPAVVGARRYEPLA